MVYMDKPPQPRHGRRIDYLLISVIQSRHAGLQHGNMLGYRIDLLDPVCVVIPLSISRKNVVWKFVFVKTLYIYHVLWIWACDLIVEMALTPISQGVLYDIKQPNSDGIT